MIDQHAGEAVVALHDLVAEQRRRTGTIAALLLLVLIALWWKL